MDSFGCLNTFFAQFDRSSSGLSGLSFEEGAFPVFGYVIKVRDYLEVLEKHVAKMTLQV